MTGIYILSARRTPIGKFHEDLSGLRAAAPVLRTGGRLRAGAARRALAAVP